MNTPAVLDKLRQIRWLYPGLAAICGSTTTMAFAPFNLSALVFPCFGLFFLMLLGSNSKTAFTTGYFFGVGLFGSGVYWINVSMSQFGGVSLPVSVFLTCLFVLFLALFPAVSAWSFARFFSNTANKHHWIVVLPAVYVFVEWIRGWIFTGFPWLSIGYSQIDSPLRGYIPLTGVFGLSFITLICASLFAWILYAGRPALKFAIPGIIVIFVAGLGLSRIEWTTPNGQPLTATLVQGNVSQDKKWLASQRQPTIDLYTELTRQNWHSDLIVWPETALPAFYHQAKSFLERLQAEATQNNSDVILGLPVMDRETKRYFNAVVSLGKKTDFYHKQHLVPFGEFIPLRNILGDILKVFNVPLPDFSYSNNKKRLLDIEGQKVGISICYEDAFGEEAILALPQANLLVNVSNDAWFGDSIAPPQHLQIARMRAAETGRPLLRATNTGITAFIDHHGKITSKLPQFKADALTARVQPMAGSTPYISWGNGFIVTLMTLILVGSYWRSQR